MISQNYRGLIKDVREECQRILAPINIAFVAYGTALIAMLIALTSETSENRILLTQARLQLADLLCWSIILLGSVPSLYWLSRSSPWALICLPRKISWKNLAFKARADVGFWYLSISFFVGLYDLGIVLCRIFSGTASLGFFVYATILLGGLYAIYKYAIIYLSLD